MAKRDRVDLFRSRLEGATTTIGMSKSALARATGVDRSTIGQLFKKDLTRLPNAQLAADIAETLGVSLDWLMGLSNRPERPAAILASAISVAQAERSSSGAQILDWHRESAGSKIRHVPATLPEMLKTEDFIEWEYNTLSPEAVEQVKSEAKGQLDWVMSGEADYEIAIPMHEVTSLAQGSGYYEGLSAAQRTAQLRVIARQAAALYPRLRLFLFDAHALYSAPVTVFSNDLAILYVGQCYIALRERQRVMALSEHFDWLVRLCAVDAKDVGSVLGGLVVAE
ncbi:MAG: helix-turn-helix transcriptional regulator [Pseudomonadota bacterium]